MLGPPELSRPAFERLRALVYELSGIALRDSKRDLLAGRLAKRLRHHGLDDFADYLALVGNSSEERVALVNCITTNKTSFFREVHHFQTLRETLAPRWVERARRGGSTRVRIWSAGCSTGEEPYSIAMALHDALPGLDFQVIGSDIDTEVLRVASRGVYEADGLAEFPAYAQRHVEIRERHMRVAPAIRARVELRQVNLIEPRWPLAGPFDAIFCRNVVIYFDKPTQERLFDRFAQVLGADGRLFIGHSESLAGVCDRFVLDGVTMYRLRGVAANDVESVIVGDVRASARPVRYTTVLGSCVSACLFDPVARVGGMNHFALVAPQVGEQDSGRYGRTAMAMLLRRVRELGASPERLQAKVFGASTANTAEHGVAEANARFVHEALAAARIPIASERLGRARPLEVHFSATDGRAMFRELVGGG